MFALYFLVSLFAFCLRPGAIKEGDELDLDATNRTSEENFAFNATNPPAPVNSPIVDNATEFLCNYSTILEPLTAVLVNLTDFNNETAVDDGPYVWEQFSDCPLLDISTLEKRVS